MWLRVTGGSPPYSVGGKGFSEMTFELRSKFEESATWISQGYLE